MCELAILYECPRLFVRGYTENLKNIDLSQSEISLTALAIIDNTGKDYI